mmetsp:Transcript_23959/g.42055  ORF Transcript_23959/g.42055 Transcript_23959/m.42055 type:complete len:261 (+) Transcript_23959:135-917(+)
MNVKNIFITLLAGIAVIIGVVVLVYLMSIVFDKYCCCLQRTENYTLTPEELEERQRASNLTRRAGLAGILSDERSRIFRHFFTQRTLTYRKPPTADEGRGSEMGPSVSCTEETSDGDDQEARDPTVACPICLSEYTEGDKIISGTSCSHCFHMECCMQWLEKGNDHCAYCRKDMMTPAEMLQAAREELGDDRVNKITRINSEAARRLAEYEAAIAAGTTVSEASRQLASGTLPGDRQQVGGTDDDHNNNATSTTNVEEEA